MTCVLCAWRPEDTVWHQGNWRVIRAEEAGHPAFYRLISEAHVPEFTDLTVAQRWEAMNLLAAIETALIQSLSPQKINLASLGNVVPHLHWHVIARFAVDRHFPAPVWAAPQREDDEKHIGHVLARLPELESAMRPLLTRAMEASAALSLPPSLEPQP